MARATRDLDFTVRSKPGGAGDMILALVQDVGAIDASDHFSFRAGESGVDLDGTPYGGARSRRGCLEQPALDGRLDPVREK